jgi:hypothetical protein
MIFVGFLLAPGELHAQGPGSWWGSTSWFDWSDFRAAGGVRLFLARLDSGNIELPDGRDLDLMGGFGITDDPEPFVEVWGTIYLDRLGFRFAMEDNFAFRGRSRLDDPFSVSELDIRTSRLGVDIDLIRYPFLRAGINFDYHTKPVKFIDRLDGKIAVPATWPPQPPERLYLQRYGATYLTAVRTDSDQRYLVVQGVYLGDQPITMGIHVMAIPGRVREIPITIQSRFRLRIPLLNRRNEARIYDFEISGGLRPSVWETSLYGYTTFSASLEAGFRWQALELSMDQATRIGPNLTEVSGPVKLHARWQGAFLQLGIAF